jgi:hypothetical protein
MQKIIIVLFFFWSINGRTQTQVLLLGNTDKLCTVHIDTIHYDVSDTLPIKIDHYQAVLIFSSAQSVLNQEDIERLFVYLESGNGIYLGCENWPLQSEANQLSKLILGKEFWGNSNEEMAHVSSTDSPLFENKTAIFAGNSSVQFPLDYRLKTEAWVADEPLIQSSSSFGGKLLLDGGYSRFYCDQKKRSDDIWMMILTFLLSR